MSAPRELDAAALAGLLADEHRRRVAAALMLDASTVEDIERLSGLSPADAGKALARLVSAGLVVRGADGTLHLVGESFARAARRATTARPRWPACSTPSCATVGWSRSRPRAPSD
jgi:DNA-binding transcriptional ArsR family regulator